MRPVPEAPALLTFLSILLAIIAIDTQSVVAGVTALASFLVGVFGLIDWITSVPRR